MKTKSKTVLYFAYGSNLDEAQMRERCRSARPRGQATLRHHALVFGGFSHRWGGAVASIQRERGPQVEGVLYRISRRDLANLDRIEGHPYAYKRVRRVVTDSTGRKRMVWTYRQPDDGFEPWMPPPEYFRVIVGAYRRLGLDPTPLARAVGVFR